MDVEIQTVRFENLKYRVSSDLERCQLQTWLIMQNFYFHIYCNSVIYFSSDNDFIYFKLKYPLPSTVFLSFWNALYLLSSVSNRYFGMFWCRNHWNVCANGWYFIFIFFPYDSPVFCCLFWLIARSAERNNSVLHFSVQEMWTWFLFVIYFIFC